MRTDPVTIRRRDTRAPFSRCDVAHLKKKLVHLSYFFRILESLPGGVDVGNHLALGGHVSWPVGEAKLRLERVKRSLQSGFLLQTGRLLSSSVLDE